MLIRKLLTIILFFTFSPFIIGFAFLGLYFYNNNGQILGAMISPISSNHLYASLPVNTPEISLNFKTEDARCLLVEKYLLKYNSPLAPYSQLICETSKKYNLDYRLLVSIAQQESNLCKTSPPEWHNCWGWGIHSKGTKTYQSYEEAIESVASGLKVNYCDKGYCDDPCLMMKKYTPNSNGSWCFGVKKFQEEIEQSS